MPELPRVTIWNEFRHEQEDEPVKAIYPDGMHAPSPSTSPTGASPSASPPSISPSTASPRRS